MRNGIRLAVVALVFTLASPGAAFAARPVPPPAPPEKVAEYSAMVEYAKPEVRGKLALRMAQDPDIAAAENAFATARKSFLALFPDAYRPWAGNLLARNAEVSGYELENMARTDRYGTEARDEYLKKRAALTRYMTLVSKTPFTDPAFLILLKPVLQHAVAYPSAKGAIDDALAEYDEHANDPYREKDGYLVRRVNGQYWAAIILPAQQVGSSSGSDKNMAFVLRVESGSFLLNPVIAPVKEDFYPGERYPLRPEKYEYGPGGVSINECVMEPVLTVTNDSGPFAFRADARQVFGKQGLSYTCEPKCGGFTYAWNDTTGSFLMAEGTCRDDDGWKAQSPFNADNTLRPVESFIDALAETDASVRAHKREVETAVAAYLALFDGTAQEVAASFIKGWKTDRQFALYRLLGKRDEFTAAFVNNDAAVLAYLTAAASLAKTPDARLVLLLEDMAARVPLLEKRPGNERDERRQPSGHELLRDGKKIPWFAAYAARRMALLEEPEKRDGKRRYYNDLSYTASGLEGGETITFTYGEDSPRRGENQTYASTFLMKKGNDGAFWGYAEVAVGTNPADAYHDSPRRFETPRLTILRVREGTVSFPLPPLPEEKEFFTNPVTDHWGRVLWKVPGHKQPVHACEMAPAFSVDTSSAPFGLRAHDVARYSYYNTCVPECEIPYTWNGSAYVKGAPECLPAGQWGVSENTQGW